MKKNDREANNALFVLSGHLAEKEEISGENERPKEKMVEKSRLSRNFGRQISISKIEIGAKFRLTKNFQFRVLFKN